MSDCLFLFTAAAAACFTDFDFQRIKRIKFQKLRRVKHIGTQKRPTKIQWLQIQHRNTYILVDMSDRNSLNGQTQ